MTGRSLLLPVFAATAPGPTLVTPRDYQVAADAAIAEHLRTRRSGLVVMATGLGKTVVAGMAAQRAAGRVLFLAHLDTLVQQSRKALQEITGREWDLEQGEWKATVNATHNVVASVQTLMQPHRLERFPADTFELVIVDEAHHYVSPAFRRPLDYFKTAKLLGITATPDRKDKLALGAIFEGGGKDGKDPIFDMGIGEGIEAAWLSPISVEPYRSEIDLSSVKWDKLKGDYQIAALDEAIAREVAPIVAAALELAGDHRTIIFTPGVKSAHTVAEALCQKRPGCARAVDGGQDKAIKRGAIAGHKIGDFQFLVNCGVLIEGYDDARVTCEIDAAPTTSRARFVQKLGRITRLWPGVDKLATVEERVAAIASSPKPSARYIDLVFSSKRHELAHPADVLGGLYSDEERKRAKKILQKKGGEVRTALEEARKKLQEEAARRAARAAAANGARVRFRKDGRPSAPERMTASGEVALTPAQEGKMKRDCIPIPQDCTKRQATKLIGENEMRVKKGLVNLYGVAWLGRNLGIDGRRLYRETAEALRAAWKANGKTPLSFNVIDDILRRGRTVGADDAA